MGKFNEEIYFIQNTGFNFFIILSYLLIFLATLGISNDAIFYLNTIDYYIRIYISLFLIWRFNPLRKVNFTELDRKIVFTSGLFILTTSALNNYILEIQHYIKKIFHN